MITMYYPKILINYEDLDFVDNGVVKQFILSKNDTDLGAYFVPIFITREECEYHYPDSQIMEINFFENLETS